MHIPPRTISNLNYLTHPLLNWKYWEFDENFCEHLPLKTIGELSIGDEIYVPGFDCVCSIQEFDIHPRTQISPGNAILNPGDDWYLSEFYLGDYIPEFLIIFIPSDPNFYQYDNWCYFSDVTTRLDVIKAML